MSESPLKIVLARLGLSEQRGREHYSARCPAHDDRTASLSISEGADGRALLKCHAGCPTEAVAAKLGLEMRDLMAPAERPAPQAKSRPREVVARYVYEDADGSPRFRSVRYEPKDFRQQRPDGRGGWAWGLGDVEPVPYHLPEVLAASERGGEVYVVEGEKDADALRALGFTATCNPMGAGKWRPEYAAPLAGAHAVILPDNDVPGRAHALDVARSLVGVAASVRVVALPDLPPKGDVSDALAAGLTPDALRALTAEAPPFDPDATASPSDAPPGEGPKEEKRERETASASLVRLARASGAEFWHDAEADAFVTTPTGGRHETHRLRHKGARLWLTRLFYVEHGRAPGAQALDDALGVLEAHARYDGPAYRRAVRVAEEETDAGPVVYLDLCNERWEVARVERGRWDVVAGSNCPVRFERRRGLLPLPTPTAGGDARALGALLNLDPDGGDLVLVLAWLVQALRGRGPYPVLEVTGEQGSGKSTAARVLRDLVDPNVAPLRSIPRSDHEAAISAENAHVLNLDNVSGLNGDASDRMCRLSTGGGLSVRELYTSDEERLFNAARPQIINGIADIASRPDLAERTVALRLRRIEEGGRRTEAALRASFEAAHPAILGGLLDAVAAGLERLPSVKLDRLPRMADFAVWATACEEALGFEPGAFLDAYEEGRATLIEATVEGEPVAEAVRKLAASGRFEGTAAELLDQLTREAGYGSDGRRAPKEWPANARALSGRLRRLAPSLRALGLAVEFERQGAKRTRVVTIQNEPADLRPHRPLRPPPGQNGPELAGIVGGGADANPSGPPPFASAPSSFASAPTGSSEADSGSADATDAEDAKHRLRSDHGDELPADPAAVTLAVAPAPDPWADEDPF